MKDICIYHGNCADGFTAAWAVWKRHGDSVEYHPGVYQQDPPDVTGRNVVMVDFSYKRPVILAMAAQAEHILILDHHKTAAEDLVDLPENVEVVFDMDRSGAMIAWEYFHSTPPPKALEHVQDRDLWRFDLPKTREIQACIFSYPYEFETWDSLMLEKSIEELAMQGEAIERKHHKDVAELVDVVTRVMKFRAPWLDGDNPSDIGFVNVPVANLPYTLTSDAGHLLCGEDYPFAGCYWDTPRS